MNRINTYIKKNKSHEKSINIIEQTFKKRMNLDIEKTKTTVCKMWGTGIHRHKNQ